MIDPLSKNELSVEALKLVIEHLFERETEIKFNKARRNCKRSRLQFKEELEKRNKPLRNLQIELKTDTFILLFRTKNSNAVHFNSRVNSTCYNQFMRNETDNLLCFDPPTTYAEYRKNGDRQIFITESSNSGYHCLFGHPLMRI